MTFTFQRYGPLMPVDRESTCRVIDDAHLTIYQRKAIADRAAAPRFMNYGAVYDSDGVLVEESQRRGGLQGDFYIAGDPPVHRAARIAERFDGTWLYAGNWMGQFGHWLTETLPNVWPLPHSDVRGIIAHRFAFDSSERSWQRAMLDAAGASGLPLHIVNDRPVSVQRLLVPSRPVVINGFAAPEAVDVWERVGATLATPATHPLVYFSVTDHRTGGAVNPSRVFDNQGEADQVFAQHGFHVVTPESVSIKEQISLARGAQILAGWSGSALHLSIFAPSTTRVLELGDIRSGAAPVPHQRALTAARGQEHGFISAGQQLENRRPYDLENLERVLGSI
ncbi:glycosyltransferase 61 family protein [Microbacterium sp. NPDC079176]|uniref:glycosyltransferase family 61 protein n=1 Tax=Microbacterium sp. NPDC079176 TaxID=3154768 RepID=UPI0034451C2F